MKLIIDIDKEDFEIMKHNIAVDNPLCPINQKDMVLKIANGTPFDNLRAELHATAEMHDDGDYYLRDEWIDEYFDEYKVESKD